MVTCLVTLEQGVGIVAAGPGQFGPPLKEVSKALAVVGKLMAPA